MDGDEQRRKRGAPQQPAEPLVAVPLMPLRVRSSGMRSRCGEAHDASTITRSWPSHRNHSA